MSPSCPHCNSNKQVVRSLKRYEHRGKWFCRCANNICCWFDIIVDEVIKDVLKTNECNCGSNVKGHVPNGPYCRGI